ncbi:putative inorganic phosphate transporter pho88 [Endogone sp. FLAS-F59071]|nr:putative inorganic phosphate transporter pho88 [Endogone sp. FLAS-F59071]|eukprot:RUS22716.1 putative inorganic phosphate transporter pho88 [Endogone sp. FLAS-F59071]
MAPPPAFLSNPFFNAVFILGIVQLSKRFDLEVPTNLMYARIVYASAQVVLIALTYGLIFVVKKKNDTTQLRYVEPPKMGQGGEPELVNITHAEYDVRELKKAITSTLTGMAMIGFLHFQFKFTQPLIIQSILPLKTFLLSNEARIHIWGEKAEGDLKRPFKVQGPFDFLGGESSQPRTDKQAIKKAEKAAKDN